MSSGLEVVAHPTGLWLVRAGRTAYAVPAAVGQALREGDKPVPEGMDPEQWAAFVASLSAALDGGGSASGHRLPPPIWLRLPLLPARLVGWMAGQLTPLTGGRGLAGCVLVGLVGFGHLALAAAASPIRLAPGSVGLALGCFLLTALWHELGHAAAIARHGYPPGGIGLGLLFVIPVLFADVTAVGALPRAERVRVDLSGVVFQFGLGGVLALVGRGLGDAFLVGAWLALVAVCWSLFPFIRADGYWLVCDMLGVDELEVDPEPRPQGWVRRILSVYRLVNAVFLLGVGFWLPLRYVRHGEAVLDRLGWNWTRTEFLVPLVMLAGVGLGYVWWNILRRVWRLIQAAF